jgi:hypothetical protein
MQKQTVTTTKLNTQYQLHDAELFQFLCTQIPLSTEQNNLSDVKSKFLDQQSSRSHLEIIFFFFLLTFCHRASVITCKRPSTWFWRRLVRRRIQTLDCRTTASCAISQRERKTKFRVAKMSSDAYM